MNSLHSSTLYDQPSRHEFFMRLALEEAKTAAQNDEVPVGAVLVHRGKIIGKGQNQREAQKFCIGHAEIAAITMGNVAQSNWRLLDCELYVTLEPCLMCAGAILQSRIKSVYYSINDPKAGALVSLYNVGQDPRLNHRFSVHSGLLADESRRLLQDFFKKRREEKALTLEHN